MSDMPGEVTREFYREQGRKQVRPALAYAVANGRESYREDLLEALEGLLEVSTVPSSREGYKAAIELIGSMK